MTDETTAARVGGTWISPVRRYQNVWFPGRWIGGAALIAGPVIWLIGLILRYLALHSGTFSAEELAHFAEQPFAAPGQLAAYVEEPGLVTAGYAAFLLGAILLFPAFATLARLVAARSPGLAFSGATLLLLGCFARAYWAGVDHSALLLTEAQQLDRVTTLVLDLYVDISYGPLRVPITAAFGQYVGALLLAVGAYRAKTFGLGRALLFLWWGVMWTGVLKASQLADVVSAAGLCVVLIPLGFQVLRERIPELRTRCVTSSVGGRNRLVGW